MSAESDAITEIAQHIMKDIITARITWVDADVGDRLRSDDDPPCTQMEIIASNGLGVHVAVSISEER
jgi:hypothetical protein